MSAPKTPADALLPCPCCASIDVASARHELCGVIFCRSCGLRAVDVTAWNTRTTSPGEDQAAEGAAGERDKLIQYVLRYGGRCRDCGDEDGVCPSSGLPCGGGEKAVGFVVDALNFGLNHGYIQNNRLTAPAAIDEWTVEELRQSIRGMLDTPGWSHNSYARTIGLSSAKLSEFLSGKRGAEPSIVEPMGYRWALVDAGKYPRREERDPDLPAHPATPEKAAERGDLVTKLQWVSNEHVLAAEYLRLNPGFKSAQVSVERVTAANHVLAEILPAILAALAQPAAQPAALSSGDDLLTGAGWVYHNPDTGWEYAPNHPIKSGEVHDATDIRRSTEQEDHLHSEVQRLFQAALTSPPATSPEPTDLLTDIQTCADRGTGLTLDAEDVRVLARAQGWNEAIEAVAAWYETAGWQMDEDAVPSAIRALSTAPAPTPKE